MKKIFTYLSFATLALAGYWNYLNQQQCSQPLDQIIQDASNASNSSQSKDVSLKHSQRYWQSSI